MIKFVEVFSGEVTMVELEGGMSDVNYVCFHVIVIEEFWVIYGAQHFCEDLSSVD